MSIYENYYSKLIDYLESKNVPHIMFYGDYYTGKKTMLNNFINMIYEYDDSNKRRYVLHIDCTSSKGIKMIKEQVIFFAKKQINKSKFDFKSIVLYDADFLTHDAQYSLRRCIEQYSSSTRFFIICTNKNKLLNPICSRFTQLYFGEYQKNFIFNDSIDDRKLLVNTITLKKKLNDILVCNHIELLNIINNLYLSGYNSKQILQYFKTNKKYNEACFEYDKYSKEIINERLSMLNIIMFFRNNQDI